MLDNIKDVNDLLDFMLKNIKYGFVSNTKEHFVRNEVNEDIYMKNLFKSYYLQTPSELLDSLCGLCYDHVELERYWLLNNNYKVYTYLTNLYNHSILLYYDGNYNWFETTIKGYYGIHTYKTLNEFYERYCKIQLKECDDDVILYPFSSVKFGCDFYDYIFNIKSNNHNRLILHKKDF